MRIVAGRSWFGLSAASLVFAIGSFAGCGGSGNSSAPIETREALGRALFHDKSLSTPEGQACGDCHQEDHGFADPDESLPTSEGVVKGLFGNRQAPALSYSAFSPAFFFDEGINDYIGGQFWDGRAKTLEDQAQGPLLSAAEMNNPSKEAVVAKLRNGPFANAMTRLYGNDVFDSTDKAMGAFTNAIASFESTSTFARFSSKFDAYQEGTATLSASEARGLALFNGKGMCNSCHPSGPEKRPLFTDFSYSNLGLPKNPDNRFYTNPSKINPAGFNFVDLGLYEVTKRPRDKGRFKTPSLRNVALTAPYTHNGVFKTLEEVVNFYNKRDLGGFNAPEVPETISRDQFGNLKLTDQDVKDIVAFLNTLTDGYRK